MNAITIGIFLASFLSFISSPVYGYYWGNSTSEETQPSVCGFGDLVSGFACTGGYCDNVRPECQSTRLPVLSRFWTEPISEERSGDTCVNIDGENIRCPHYQQLCGTTGFLSGVACSGPYCDNLSSECVYLRDFVRTGCYWSTWVSEENGGTLLFPTGYYAAGAECNGPYCDNLRFYVCQLRAR